MRRGFGLLRLFGLAWPDNYPRLTGLVFAYLHLYPRLDPTRHDTTRPLLSVATVSSEPAPCASSRRSAIVALPTTLSLVALRYSQWTANDTPARSSSWRSSVRAPMPRSVCPNHPPKPDAKLDPRALPIPFSSSLTDTVSLLSRSSRAATVRRANSSRSRKSTSTRRRAPPRPPSVRSPL